LIFMKHLRASATVFFLMAVSCYATPGKLDTAFVPQENARISAIENAPAGGLYVAGLSLKRVNTNGTLDPSFVCPITMGQQFESLPVVLADKDGSLLVAGTFEVGPDRMFIARILPTGAIDPSYHHAIVAPAVPASIINGGALDSSGRMIVVGPFQTVDGQPATYMARILQDGRLDPTFTLSASVGIPVTFGLLPDGRLAVGGENGVWILKNDGSLDLSVSPNTAVGSVSALAVSGTGQIAIAQGNRVHFLRGDLTEDTSFSSDFIFQGNIDELRFAAGGAVLAAGEWWTSKWSPGPSLFGIQRFLPNGSIDSSWSSLRQGNGRFEHMRITPTGDIYVSGRFTAIQGVPRPGFARLHGSASGATQWVNNSARATISGTGQSLILGFVVLGDEPIQALVRAVGPSLAGFGVTTPLQHPTISLYAGITEVYSTTGWNDSADMRAIQDSVGAFPLSKNSSDSAGIAILQPGAYTLVVTAPAGETGSVLGEVYKVQ
jgi:hypothetical protein